MTQKRAERLHWTQRVALVQHHLHIAGLSRDFTFFKSLQAHILMEGNDCAAALTQLLNGDDAATDSIVENMDKFNAVIACVYEDAFKNVYGSVKACITDRQGGHNQRRAILRMDLIQQKQMADESIDKMLSLAVDMIRQQPTASQDAAANVLIRGATFAANAMEVSLMHMDAIEDHMDDPLYLESSWSLVQGAVGSAVSAMKGVFSLMASNENENGMDCNGPEPKHTRSQSIDGYARQMLRRMSVALSPALPSSSSSGSSGASRNGSAGSWTSAISRKNSSTSLISHARPNFTESFTPSAGTKTSHSGITNTTLSPIPATPAAATDSLRNPFDATFANHGAFSSNANDSPRAPEPDDPMPAERCSSRSSRSSDSIAPTDTSDRALGGRQDGHPSSLSASALEGVSATRRRSSNVQHGEAPTLENLVHEIKSIFVAPAANRAAV